MGWIEKDGTKYYRISRTIGKKLNENGFEVPVRREFTARTKKEATQKYEEYLENRASDINNANVYFGITADAWINDFFIPDDSLKGSTKAQYLSS
ncbi:MAG: hypothetical protein IJJ01_03520 [Firmicutes bacterium]|nr:hypothetical protein [Bacillota bacterium]